MKKPLQLLGLALVAGAAITLVACDRIALNKLKPGISTQADVEHAMGRPARVWPLEGGAQALEYNRQPMGTTNYMVRMGADGRLEAVVQVLTPENFARVQPGMDADAVRRLLGKPARRIPYALQHQVVWTWRYQAQPTQAGAFNVTFDDHMRVVEAATGPDPEGPDMVGGG